MREKFLRLIITFHTTSAAMAFEKLCKEEKIEGRLIPVPRIITSDCGMAWCAKPETHPVIERAIKSKKIDIEGFYEVIV